MPNNLKKKSYTLYSLHLPILIAIFAIVAGGSYLATNKVVDTGNLPEVQGKKTEKTTGNAKSVKDGTTAEVHKNVVEKVAKELKTVANTEKVKGNEEVSDELTTIAEEQEATAEDTAEALEEVESAPTWKTILIGPDYKNLGQLRSTLAHNTNAIRKLVKATESLGVGESNPALEASLTLLNVERDNLISVIKAEESQFSILGWVSKLLSGYISAPIEDEVTDDTDGTEGTDSSAPDDETEGIGETNPSPTDTTGAGTTEPGTTEPGTGDTENPESNPGL